MAWLNSLLIVLQVICAVSITVLILLQHGKGADMGAAFGSGASGSLFGASGSANFLSRTTAVLASIFFITTIAMAYVATASRSGAARSDHAGVMSGVGKDAPAPAVPGGPNEIPPSAAPGKDASPPPAGSQTPTPANRASDIPK
jgi:preprotein translocase subunit SecG